MARHDVYDEGSFIQLTDKNLLGAGGEGAVYVINNTAYKIYHDPKKALPGAKIAELSAISHPSVVAPQSAITNAKGVVVGYRMKYVPHSKTLCEVSTRAYRERNGIGIDSIQDVVESLKAIVHAVHKANVVVVDLNDLNVLIRSNHKEAVLIDLDSAQTPNFDVTAIMEAIRDPLVPEGSRFKAESDWYAFAVLAFRAFTGSGPYRGFHPKGIKEVERKKLGLSAFDTDCRLPASAYPLDVIPAKYRDWMQKILAHKLRAAPEEKTISIPKPTPIEVIAPATSKAAKMDVIPLLQHRDKVRRAWMVGNQIYSHVGYGIYRGAEVNPVLCNIPAGARLALHPTAHKPLWAWIDPHDQYLTVVGLTGTVQKTDIQTSAISEAGSNILVKSEDGIYALTWMENAQGTIHTGLRRLGNCLQNATILGDGAAIMRGLGRAILLLFPNAQQCIEIPMPQLDNHRIISVCAEGYVAVVGTTSKMTWSRDLIVVRQDPTDHSKVDFLQLEDAGMEADMAAIATIAAVHTEEGVTLTSTQPYSTQRASWALPDDIHGPLLNLGGRICTIQKNAVVQLKTPSKS